MAEVRFEQATRIFRGNDVPAVDRLDLTLTDGELLVLVGPSGSGKSTALRMLAGLEEVDAGAITSSQDVTDIRQASRHRDGVPDYAVSVHGRAVEHRLPAQDGWSPQGRPLASRRRGRRDARSDLAA
jgi:ABC-type Fe3+/spermidine/putrescine transport system ATPase subunit